MSRKVRRFFKTRFEQEWYKQNVIVLMLSFVLIFGFSSAYAALNQSLEVKGDVVVRAEADIRIDDITSNLVDCGYDQYNPKYMVDRINVNLILPALDCTIKYDVVVRNYGTSPMELIDIVEENYNNPNIIYSIEGYAIGDVIEPNTELTFTITFRYNPSLTVLPTNTGLGATILFVWARYTSDGGIIFTHKGECEQFIIPLSGIYRLEVWGAQGGNGEGGTSLPGGNGGYSTGQLYLNKDEILFVCVGGKGLSGSNTTNLVGGFNGGGVAQGNSSITQVRGSGGGATDIRIGTNSLLARVIVAGGGGGSGGAMNSSHALPGGYGGGNSGGNSGVTTNGQTSGAGGTQSIGGSSGCLQGNTCGITGSFGQGGSSSLPHNSGRSAGAGGGGWFGGGGGGVAGGGGSGYVLTPTSFKPSGYLLSSDFHLTNATVFNGNESIPNAAGGNQTGNSGDGVAKITFIQ